MREGVVSELLTAETLKEIIKIVPSILWFFLGLLFLFLFYKPIRYDLLPKLKGVSAMGVEVSFIRDSIDAAIEVAEKSPQWKVEVSPRDKERALSRVKGNLKVFEDADILWVDDCPENNINEQKMFRKLKAEIELVRTTEEALSRAGKNAYDLIISDMARDGNPAAGIELLQGLRKAHITAPVIFYLGVLDPEKGVPPYAFGLTNRPDELLHLVMDILERGRSKDG